MQQPHNKLNQVVVSGMFVMMTIADSIGDNYGKTKEKWNLSECLHRDSNI